jgi:hypothetical protein
VKNLMWVWCPTSSPSASICGTMDSGFNRAGAKECKYAGWAGCFGD